MTVVGDGLGESGGLELRMMTLADVGTVPIGHQGAPDQVRRRIEDLGRAPSSPSTAVGTSPSSSSAATRRAGGCPAGWTSRCTGWTSTATRSPLPEQTIVVFCYHVGQTDDSDARDPQYWGRGWVCGSLDMLVGWAAEHGYAIVAKGVPAARPVMTFLGGQPASVYESRGFTTTATWVDTELRAVVERDQLAPPGDETASMTMPASACCVRRPE